MIEELVIIAQSYQSEIAFLLAQRAKHIPLAGRSYHPTADALAQLARALRTCDEDALYSAINAASAVLREHIEDVATRRDQERWPVFLRCELGEAAKMLQVARTPDQRRELCIYISRIEQALAEVEHG